MYNIVGINTTDSSSQSILPMFKTLSRTFHPKHTAGGTLEGTAEVHKYILDSTFCYDIISPFNYQHAYPA